jgi:lipopolysaccharide export system permease protein
LNTINTEEYRFSHLARYNFTLAAPEFELENRDDNIRGDREMDVEMMLDRVDTFSREKKDEAQKISDRINERLNLMAKSSGMAYSDTSSVELAEITPSLWKDAADKAHRRISREYQSLRISSSRINNSNRMINSYMVEIHKKFSIPFASIVFILIGAPLGIAARKGSLGVGATFSIIFFLVYWACLILGEDLADRQFMPPMLAMWFPNIVLGIIGSYLTWRTVKETTIIKWDKLGRFFKKKSKKPEDQPDSP